MTLASDTSSLVHATWGLVVATALLVVAAAFPAITAVRERWNEAHSRAAMLVPDFHMLKSRFSGTTKELDEAPDPDELWCELMLDSNKEDLKMLAPLIDLAPSESLKFTSELYVARHLLTQAKFEILRVQDEVESEAPDRVATAAAVRRARNLYRASASTVDAAERLIPDRHRMIRRTRSLRREAFLDRFSRLAAEREQAAGQSFSGIDH